MPLPPSHHPTIPLFLLPFDHRASLARDVLHVAYPLKNPNDHARLSECKMLIFEAFLQVHTSYQDKGRLGVLVDEEFGGTVLDEAKRLNIPFSLTMEASGTNGFQFDAQDWQERLLIRRPTFAKALVRYDRKEATKNTQSRDQLRALSMFCADHGIGFMLEVLTKDDVTAVMDDLREHDILPTLWKIEGQNTVEDWQRIAAHAGAPIVLLGRGESMAQVDAWLTTAAKSGVVHGFAIGRTIFLEALKNFTTQRISRDEAVHEIATHYRHVIDVWEKIAVHK